MNKVIILLFIFFSLQLSAFDRIEIIDKNKQDTLYPSIYNFSAKLLNRSDSIYKISKVTSTCGCTIAKLNKYELLPGESADLDYSVDLKLSKNQKIVKILIFTEDTLKPNIEYGKKFYIKVDYDVKPKRLPAYSKVLIGDTIIYNISFRNLTSTDLTLFTPILQDNEYAKIISWNNDLKIKPNEELTFELKLLILKEKFISKLIIPTSSINQKEYDYMLVFN